MQKIKLLTILGVLVLWQGCKKDALLEDNLQSVFDFHLAEIIHQSVEIGILPRYDSSFAGNDMSLFTNIKLDSMLVTLNEPTLNEPHTFYYSYHNEIENPTKRSITGALTVTYFGAISDSINITSNAIKLGGLKTSFVGNYTDLSDVTIFGETEVSIALANRDSIFLTTTRTIKPIMIGDNDFSKQEITLSAKGTDRIDQTFSVQSEGTLVRKYECKMYYDGTLSINVNGVPDKKVTYPTSCNGTSVIESQGQLTNIIFY
jgi:hypothetical protein